MVSLSSLSVSIVQILSFWKNTPTPASQQVTDIGQAVDGISGETADLLLFVIILFNSVSAAGKGIAEQGKSNILKY